MKTRLTLLFTLLSTALFAAVQPGDTAPNFTLTDLQGQKHSLDQYKGKYVVLEWNNPGCPFVRKHYDSGNMPKLQKEERAKGVVWLTINSASANRQGDDSSADLEKFLQDEKADPTAYLRDPDGAVGHMYGAKTTPHMFVIGPDGKLIYQGGIDNRPTPDPADIPGATNYVKAALDESMSGKPVTVATSRPYGCSVKYSSPRSRGRNGRAQASRVRMAGGRPAGELRFEYEVEPQLSAALEEAAGMAGPFRALTRPGGAAGRYVATGRDGREWFVRVSARWGEPELEQAITGYLRERGLAANHLEAAGLRLEWHGERLRVDVRERVRGRHFDGSVEDLRALARTLADCHALLRGFPEAARVRELAARRFTRIDESRARMKEELARGNFGFFCQDESWARAHAEWLGGLVAGFQARCDLLPGSQCLHGQIHQANVLYAPGPVLVDWEEAVQTYAPVQWDLAYFVQRFCLHDQPAQPVARTRLEAVRDAYGAPLGDLHGMMRHVAWLSAVILVGYRQAGIESPVAEYAKFVRLEEQAREMKGILEEFF